MLRSLFAGVCFCLSLRAQTIHVVPSGATPTIGSALTAAVSGDTIQVAPGTYVEALDFGGKNVTLESTGGAAVTTLSIPGALGFVVVLQSGEGPTAVVRGFTVQSSNGLFIDGSSPTIEDCVVSCFYGGATLSNAANPTFTNVTFHDCGDDLWGDGGGLHVIGGSTATLAGCAFQNCEGARGGAIYCDGGSTLLITGSTFTGNSALLRGGAVHVENAALVTVAGTTFDGNMIDDSSSPMANVSHGCAISLVNTPMNMIDSVIRNSTWSSLTALPEGGAIRASASPINLVRTDLLDNDAYTHAAVRSDDMLTATGCRIEGNTGGDGGIFGGTTVVMNRCTVLGNTATNGPAVAGLALDLRNTVVADNDFWDLPSAVSGNGTLVNCTLANNSTLGVGVVEAGATNLALLNCIVWGNTDWFGPAPLSAGGFVTATYSDIEGGLAGTGNVTIEPHFADPSSGDYHLTRFSAVMDLGQVTPTLPATDIDGDPRIEGAAPDMGADEFLGGRPALGLGGTNEDLALLSTVGGGGVADWPAKPAGAGDVVSITFLSPGGTHDGDTAVLGAQLFASCSPPVGPPTLPGIVLDPAAPVLLLVEPALPSAGTTSSGALPPGLEGLTVRVQGVVQTPAAANGTLVATEAHDIVIQ